MKERDCNTDCMLFEKCEDKESMQKKQAAEEAKKALKRPNGDG